MNVKIVNFEVYYTFKFAILKFTYDILLKLIRAIFVVIFCYQSHKQGRGGEQQSSRKYKNVSTYYY